MKQMWAVLPGKLKWLLLTMVIANIGSAMFQPFLALYVKELGASVAEVGLYFTIWLKLTAPQPLSLIHI